MMELDFSFESSPLEAFVAQLPAGGSLSAARFLAMTEGETEAVLQDILMEMEIRHIGLDISDLPRLGGTGEAAVRLRREEQLVQEGKLYQGLEENDPLRLFLEEMQALPDTGDIQKMAAAYARGQEMVMVNLTNRMLPQVLELSCNYVGRGVLLMDLIQEGSLGLWQAILGYQDGDFVAHARWWIQMYLAKAVTLQARESGFGQRLRQAMEDYRAVDEKLLSELGRNPTVPEIAEAMHMTLEETQVVSQMLESARLLSRAKEESVPVEEENPEDTQHVEDTALFQSRQRIEELLSDLPDDEAKLLRLRFGLDGGMPLSPEETGRRLSLTPEEVVAKEAAALLKLRSGK